MFEKIDNTVSSGRFIAVGLAAIIFLLVGGAPGVQQLTARVYYWFSPVIYDVQIGRVWVEGADGLFEASARKRHSCELRAVGAENALTRSALVVPPRPRRFWPPDSELRPFMSPVRVVGGAGHVVSLDFHHRCSAYDVSSPLARVDFPPAEVLP